MSPCFYRGMVTGLLLIFCAPSHAIDKGTAAASLLAAPDEEGWSLESMVAAGRAHQFPDSNRDESNTSGSSEDNSAALHPSRVKQDDELRALRRQINSLRIALDKAQRALAERKQSSGALDDAELKRVKTALKDSEQRVGVLNQQVETLKNQLAERNERLQKLGVTQDALRRDLAEKTALLEKNNREMDVLRTDQANKEAQIASLTPAPGEKDRVESLSLALKDRDNALAEAFRQADKSRSALEHLRAEAQEKEKVARDLTTALDSRSRELKEAATALADLRAERARTAPATPEQKQAYVAGLMMADGLKRRLDGWAQAGVKTDTRLFRSGLEDGLANTLRLKAPEARRAQVAFTQAVQDGVARQVADAQKQLVALAKGRRALKSDNGITWYRVRAGKAVTPGQAVKLSMIERVAGGKEVSRVPALTLRPGDNVPAVVREGMYLPGDGGEVVAYSLARDVYGELPLPAGVQPWTVMEYHLKGETQTALQG